MAADTHVAEDGLLISMGREGSLMPQLKEHPHRGKEVGEEGKWNGGVCGKVTGKQDII